MRGGESRIRGLQLQEQSFGRPALAGRTAADALERGVHPGEDHVDLTRAVQDGLGNDHPGLGVPVAAVAAAQFELGPVVVRADPVARAVRGALEERVECAGAWSPSS
ncbi:hypothetical protein ACFVS9_09095 [Streptomyces sp. NPDC058008]|uniref:hypothetical protein n=1 Tax=Streptomyces sp. NPDC058008 TaxID=3346303 RepID=UPI0036F0233C